MEKGTYFVGNGGWGTGIRECHLMDNKEVYDKVANVEGHYWVFNVDSAKGLAVYEPFDENGELLVDPFS